MGLDYWKWRSGEYPSWFRNEVVAWFVLHRLVNAHMDNARYDYEKREMQKTKAK